MKQPVTLTVNGRPVEAMVEPRTHLADLVRDTLRLTGTRLGCEHGVCGACTVLIDGAPTRSCIAYAVACEGAEVRTIEGFDDDPLMQALRDAFTRHHALQCGYCTPGMLITAHDVIRRLPGVDEARLREELSGNLCRCTGYVGIVNAVLSVLANPPAHGDEPSDVTAQPSRPLRGPVGPAGRHGVRDAARPGPPETCPGVDTPPAAPPSRPSGSREIAGSEHEIVLTVAPHTLWPVLQNIATVAHCLPGMSLTSPADADPLSFTMTVAIGPIRARFEGTAHVAFDDRRRTAIIEGRGRDTRSRSTSEGRIELTVQPSRTGGSVLGLRLHHAIKGPLAQFSRGAVVDAVVEQLLHRFAANLTRAISGAAVDTAQPLGGVSLGVAALWRRVRHWLSGGR